MKSTRSTGPKRRVGFFLIYLLLILAGLEGLSRGLFPHRGLTWSERIADQHSLTLPKRPDEKRVFIFGASSVVGYHHLEKSSLSLAIQYALERQDPSKHWKVVNFGKAGEASEFVIGSALESMRYQPDRVIVYVGENEFIPPAMIRRHGRYRMEKGLLHSKILRLFREAVGQTPDVSMPTFQNYSYKDLMQEILAEKRDVLEDFRQRLTRLNEQVGGRVPLVVIAPLGNALWPPTFHDDFQNVDFDLKRASDRAFIRGVVLEQKSSYAAASRFFEKVVHENPGYADAHFRLGNCYRRMGKLKEAAAEYQQAIDTDAIPNRADQNTIRLLNETVTNAVFVDLQNDLLSRSKEPWLGYEWIEDNCHPGVKLEWELAKSVLREPRVQEGLEAYEAHQQLDAKTKAMIYVRVGQYHNGRSSGDAWFRKALALLPNDPVVRTAWHEHQQKEALMLDRRTAAFNRLVLESKDFHEN